LILRLRSGLLVSNGTLFEVRRILGLIEA